MMVFHMILLLADARPPTRALPAIDMPLLGVSLGAVGVPPSPAASLFYYLEV